MEDSDELIKVVKFSIQLPESYNRKLTIWARCTRKYRAAMASDIVKARIEANLELIHSLVEEVAEAQGISSKEAEQLLSEGFK